MKSNTNVNTFKHDIKKLFFDELQKKEEDIHINYCVSFPDFSFGFISINYFQAIAIFLKAALLSMSCDSVYLCIFLYKGL